MPTDQPTTAAHRNFTTDCSCSSFTGYSPMNCPVHGPAIAPTYAPVKCPDCGVWWRTPSHACIGVKP